VNDGLVKNPYASSTPASLRLAGDPGRCTAYLVTRTPKSLRLFGDPAAAYLKVRLIPRYLRALPMDFLLSRLILRS